MSPTSIVHVGKHYPPHMGGTEIYTRDLVRSHSGSANIKVVVSGDSRHQSVTTVDGAELTRLATLANVASMPVSPGLARYLAANPSDIVHLHMPNPLAALAYLVSGHRGRLILTHHADTFGRPHLRRISDPFVRLAMRRADAVIVTSQRYLDTSNELAGFRTKCHVIPLGIDAARFQADDSATVRKIHLRHGSELIVAVGRLVEFKGFHIAIEALSQLYQSSSVKLLIAGAGPFLPQLQSLAARLRVADRVVFLGSLPNEDIPALIKSARMVLFPSTRRTESFGYVQLEALACGIPVINTSVDTAASEVSLHEVTGLTVPPLDAPALTRAIVRLLADPAQCSTFGHAGIARVRDKYRLDSMSTETLELYGKVLQQTTLSHTPARMPHVFQAIRKRWKESTV